MAKDFSKQFYHSKEWKATREYILGRDKYLCSKCGAPAEEVHHIVHLSPQNVYDPKITMNPDNLISLCKNCHFKEHFQDKSSGHRKKELGNIEEYSFDEEGNIVPVK